MNQVSNDEKLFGFCEKGIVGKMKIYLQHLQILFTHYSCYQRIIGLNSYRQVLYFALLCYRSVIFTHVIHEEKILKQEGFTYQAVKSCFFKCSFFVMMQLLADMHILTCINAKVF